MKVEELATSLDKRQREIIMAAKAKESTRTESSFESLIESRRRAAMSGSEESWRDGGVGATIDKPVVTNELSGNKASKQVTMDGESNNGADKNEVISIDSSMFTSFSTNGNNVKPSPPSIYSKYIYKYNSADNGDIHPSMITTPVRLVCNSLSETVQDRVQLLLLHQTKDKQIVKMRINGHCTIVDRRIQGLLPSTIIECGGRVPTEALNRAYNTAMELVPKHRLFACFQMVIDPSCDADYDAFCSNYGVINDRVLAGDWGEKKNVTVLNIVPPTLIHKLSVLRTFTKEYNLPSTTSTGNKILYGILHTTQWGDLSYVTDPNVAFVPFIDNSNSTSIIHQPQKQSGDATDTASNNFFNQLYK